MLEFKSFSALHCVLAGVELMHMIFQGQFAINGTDAMSLAGQFYALAGKISLGRGAMCQAGKFRSLLNNATEG